MPYLLDSDVFIQAKNLHYSFDVCPAFWEWIDLGHERGLVFSIEKVRGELIAGDDELAAWAKHAAMSSSSRRTTPSCQVSRRSAPGQAAERTSRPR